MSFKTTPNVAIFETANLCLGNTMREENIKLWPCFIDYPNTESGWNRFIDDWIIRKRQAAGIGQIPVSAIEEYRATMQMGRDKGWKESE